MNRGAGARGEQSEKTDANPEGSNDPFACGLSGRFEKPNAMRKQDHSDTEECVEHDGRQKAKRLRQDESHTQAPERERVLMPLDNAQSPVTVIWITA
jgi:hypothetical protein